MKNRYKKIVLEAEESITCEVSDGTSEELLIKNQKIATSDVNLNLPNVLPGEYAESLSVYIDKDGNKAVILPGWTVSELSEENTIFGENVSLVIYRIPKENMSKLDWENLADCEILKERYDQLVWCPVELLDADGTLDGKHFTEKFGRRNYRNDIFFNTRFNEPLEGELLRQFESVKKYGGFYISRYNISKSKSGKTRSVKRVRPLVRVDFNAAKKFAANFENNEVLNSHLTYGAEYDSVLAWLIKSHAKTFEQIAKDSNQWGNHWNIVKSPKRVVVTGSCEKWCVNNIYDLAGNVDEWTQERYDDSYRIIRGGNCNIDGIHYSVAYRSYSNPNDYYKDTGFRASIYIK